MIHLVDLSEWNKGIRYPELCSAIAGAYIKATDARRTLQGWIPFVDPLHETHSVGIRACGKPTGSYCFGHPSQDANASADFFVANAFFDQLRPCLDLESLNPDKSVPSNAGDHAARWLDRVETNSGVSPIGYSGAYYLEAIIKQTPSLRDRDWWVAAYPGSMVPPDHMPTVAGLLAARVLAWQWTGSGRLPGIDGNADRDVAPSLGPLYVVAPQLDAGHERLGA